MCLYPQLIKNPKYKTNKKNGGIIPAVTDERVTWVPIGCQKCIECKKQKAREWKVRLNEEVRKGNKGIFITLTFSNENYRKLLKLIRETKPQLESYDIDNQICTYAVRKWLERWRKEHKKSVRHWLITEIGGGHSEHIHIHGIVWTNKPEEDINKHWQYGYVWKPKPGKGYINEKTINYIIKYLHKTDPKHKHYKPIILTSAGIGNNYTGNENKYNGEKTKDYYRTRQGWKLGLPIYYRNKAYTEEEREKLWLQKLDKQERYILGQKIDISKTEENYNKILKDAQELNERIGYRGNENNWEEEEYERKRRILKQKEKIGKANGPGPGAENNKNKKYKEEK